MTNRFETGDGSRGLSSRLEEDHDVQGPEEQLRRRSKTGDSKTGDSVLAEPVISVAVAHCAISIFWSSPFGVLASN